MMHETLELRPVGWVQTLFDEKFGTPRQPGLVRHTSHIAFAEDIDPQLATRELDSFSHIWLIFWFHQARGRRDQPLVRPPRLGGNRKVGVFASRSPFRPNPLGLSLVRHRGLTQQDGRTVLQIEGADLVNGTPVLDIKPYLPYTEAIPDALGGFAPEAPRPRLTVTWSPAALDALPSLERLHSGAGTIIEETLSLDPRPAYRHQEDSTHGVRMFGWNVVYCVTGEQVTVQALEPPAY